MKIFARLKSAPRLVALPVVGRADAFFQASEAARHPGMTTLPWSQSLLVAHSHLNKIGLRL